MVTTIDLFGSPKKIYRVFQYFSFGCYGFAAMGLLKSTGVLLCWSPPQLKIVVGASKPEVPGQSKGSVGFQPLSRENENAQSQCRELRKGHLSSRFPRRGERGGRHRGSGAGIGGRAQLGLVHVQGAGRIRPRDSHALRTAIFPGGFI